MKNKRPIVCDEEFYEIAYGGECIVDFDPRRKQFIVALYNEDVGQIFMRLNEDLAYNCTPDLIFNRFEEKYIQALEQRAQGFYDEFTRDLIKRSIDNGIDIRR